MARRNLLHVIALAALGLVCARAGLVAEASKRLDCSNTYGGASFKSLGHICGAVTDDKLFDAAKDGEDQLIKLETIETCACALINHDLAWASLMTHENEVLFLSIRQFVDRWDQNEEKNAMVKDRSSHLLFQGPEGERRYYWDRLDDILRNAQGENDDEDISLMIRENFSKIYYDPATFKAKFNSPNMMQSQKLRTLVSDTCKIVLGKFAEPLLKFFDRLSRLSENDRLFYSLTTYNDDLYKIRLNTKTCLYLLEKGQLVV